MANRYHARGGESAPGRATGSSHPFEDGWLALGAIAVALIVATALLGTLAPHRVGPATTTSAMLAAVEPGERSLAALESAFAELCREPVLIGLELEPDCETGVLTLPDAYYSGIATPRVRRESREYLVGAMAAYLARIRQLPAIWESLEAIEIRGHVAPQDVRGGPAGSLAASQARAAATLLFLIGADGVASDEDRVALERLAIVSASADEHPPPDCSDATPACRTRWRRVEIRPVLSESLRRGDWARTLAELRMAAAGGPEGFVATASVATPSSVAPPPAVSAPPLAAGAGGPGPRPAPDAGPVVERFAAPETP